MYIFFVGRHKLTNYIVTLFCCKLLVYREAIFWYKLLLYISSLFLKISNFCRENILLRISTVCTDTLLLQSCWQFCFLGKGSILCSNNMSYFFVVLLQPCKEILGKYFVIGQNHFHTYSNSFPCYRKHYIANLTYEKCLSIIQE